MPSVWNLVSSWNTDEVDVHEGLHLEHQLLSNSPRVHHEETQRRSFKTIANVIIRLVTTITTGNNLRSNRRTGLKVKSFPALTMTQRCRGIGGWSRDSGLKAQPPYRA